MQFSIDFLSVTGQLSHALRLCTAFDPEGKISTLKMEIGEESAGDQLLQKMIVQSPWDKFEWLRKVPFLKSLGHQIPALILKKFSTNSSLIFSEGNIPPAPSDLLYLYDLKSLYFLRALRNHNPAKMAVSSQYLKEAAGLKAEVRVIPPPIPTEDFPYIEVITNKKSIAVLLPKNAHHDLTWLNHYPSTQDILILGGSPDCVVPLQDSIKRQIEFCHGTIQAAYLESFLVFDFLSTSALPTYGLLALAHQCVVATKNSAVIHEFLPMSATFTFSRDPLELVDSLNLMKQVYLSLDWSEMRRYALRFNEKNFKQKMEKWIFPA
ncbi:MAG: hypothetical protein QE271_03120 [Bacteriovoracaceae bacterium]|nr:hypothetical protein [Bacteriovoracaceae bacterium]